MVAEQDKIRHFINYSCCHSRAWKSVSTDLSLLHQAHIGIRILACYSRKNLSGLHFLLLYLMYLLSSYLQWLLLWNQFFFYFLQVLNFRSEPLQLTMCILKWIEKNLPNISCYNIMWCTTSKEGDSASEVDFEFYIFSIRLQFFLSFRMTPQLSILFKAFKFRN